jgi:hypothetical protein
MMIMGIILIRSTVPYLRSMCVQCMYAAMGSVAAAGGARTWLARQRAEWLTPRRLRYITIALFTAAVLVAGTLSGTS